MRLFRREAFRYTAYFCEENIWWLANDLADEGMDPAAMAVLLITNPAQRVVVMHQRAAPLGRAVVWDYHVVLELRLARAVWIFDFDSRLAFPTDLATYLSGSFPAQELLSPELRAWVRRIPASAYLTRFCSDRSHMRGVVPESVFPPYPPLGAAAARPITLDTYRDLGRALDDGSRVEPLKALREAAG